MIKIINNFIPMGGEHCITNSMKQIFHYYGFPLSEEMIFGIGECLDFTYINLAQSPMVSGRSKVMEFEKVLSENLNVSIKVKQHKDYEKVFLSAKSMIEQNHPVLAYVDMPYLTYFGMNENSHFGGHSVILFGLNEDENFFYVSDRDNVDFPIRSPKGQLMENFHKVSFDSLEKARSSNCRPFPANNKYLIFDFNGYKGITKEILISSIINVCDKMLNPPAQLKGVSGIAKFAKEIKKWNKFDDNKLSVAGATNYFQINRDGGTGGGIFRKMYGNFLIESSKILDNESIYFIGTKFIEHSKLWDEIADNMWNLSKNPDRNFLNVMSDKISVICSAETDLLTNLKDVVS